MKLLVVLMLCAIAVAAPNSPTGKEQVFDIEIPTDVTPETRNILVNALVRQLIAFLRRIINNGSDLFGIPPLDPLVLDYYHLKIPAQIINLDLHLHDVKATGFGGFVDNRSTLNLREMTFDVDITIPRIDIKAGTYDLTGDLLFAIPLFGKGGAEFIVEDLRFRGTLFLTQSEDGRSVLIERIQNASFELPHFKSNLDGVIGGGDIDAIANALIEEVFIDYVNRFQGLIAAGVAHALVIVGNPILDQLDTWRFIAPLIPNN